MCCLCLNSEQNKDMEVGLGGLSLDTEEPMEQTITVEQAIVHENYRETSQAVYNDIGAPCLFLILYKISTNISNNIRIWYLNQRSHWRHFTSVSWSFFVNKGWDVSSVTNLEEGQIVPFVMIWLMKCTVLIVHGVDVKNCKKSKLNTF